MSLDPRSDLQEDHKLWEFVLACANQYKDKNIFSNLHGFRCAGCRLLMKDKALVFKFSDEYDEETKEAFKKKYAIPYLKWFREIFKFIVENTHILEYKNRDLFERDILTEGYLD